jgi:hypothetical protein
MMNSLNLLSLTKAQETLKIVSVRATPFFRKSGCSC